MFYTFWPGKDRFSWWPWLYWTVLVGLFVSGLVIRFWLPSPPFMDPDTFTYLYPGVSWLATGEYAPTYRNFLYPVFLSAVLWMFRHLDAISYIQHLFGLGTAALVVLFFFRARVFLPPGKLLDWGTGITALVGAYLFLFSRSPIILEHSIRPEAFFPTACALTLLAGLEFSRRVFLEKRIDVLSSFWLILLIIFSIGTYYIKPAWGFTMGTSLLPLLFAFIWIPGRWLEKLGWTFFGFILAFIIFVVPEYFLQERNRKVAKSFLSETLFCTHAEFFQDILERDALRLSPNSQERTHLLKFTQDIRAAILKPSRTRYGLSLNPDDLMYGGPLEELNNGLASIKKDFSINKFYRSYYFRAWGEHPLAMLKKVFRQLEYFYSPKRVPVYELGASFGLQSKYERIPKLLSSISYPNWKPLNEYEKSIKKFNFSEKEPVSLPYFLQWIILLFNNTFLLLLILSLIAVGMVFSWGDSFWQLRAAAILLLYLASFNFANCLTISFVHMMSVGRYHFSQITMSLISQGFEILFLIAFIQKWREQRRQKPRAA